MRSRNWNIFFWALILFALHSFTRAEKSLTLLSPRGGENYEIGQGIPIRFVNNSDAITYLLVKISLDSGLNWSILSHFSSSLSAERGWDQACIEIPDSILFSFQSIPVNLPSQSSRVLLMLQSYLDLDEVSLPSRSFVILPRGSEIEGEEAPLCDPLRQGPEAFVDTIKPIPSSEIAKLDLSALSITAPKGMKAIKGAVSLLGNLRGQYPGYHGAFYAHQSAIGSFFMDTTEITVGEWEDVMGPIPNGITISAFDKKLFIQGKQYPVHWVNWYDAVLFCNARSKQEGLDTIYEYGSIVGVAGYSCMLTSVSIHLERNGYRLPTEAEWEYACRAGSSSYYPWGDFCPFGKCTDTLESYAWWIGNSDGNIQAVGKKRPNAWGLYDMLGNTWEWVNDWFAADQPGYQLDPSGPTKGTAHGRGLRGFTAAVIPGSPQMEARERLTCADRHSHNPSHDGYSGSNGVGVPWFSGFRCVRRPWGGPNVNNTQGINLKKGKLASTKNDKLLPILFYQEGSLRLLFNGTSDIKGRR